MTGRHEHPHPYHGSRHSKFITPRSTDIGDEASFGIKDADKARNALSALITEPGQHRGVEAGAHKGDKRASLLKVTANRLGRKAMQSLPDPIAETPKIV